MPAPLTGASLAAQVSQALQELVDENQRCLSSLQCENCTSPAKREKYRSSLLPSNEVREALDKRQAKRMLHRVICAAHDGRQRNKTCNEWALGQLGK